MSPGKRARKRARAASARRATAAAPAGPAPAPAPALPVPPGGSEAGADGLTGAMAPTALAVGLCARWAAATWRVAATMTRCAAARWVLDGLVHSRVLAGA
jgi:hypothetical protein